MNNFVLTKSQVAKTLLRKNGQKQQIEKMGVNRKQFPFINQEKYQNDKLK